jgi:hypothetical protein
LVFCSVGAPPPSPEDGNRSSFRNVVFPCLWKSGRWIKSRNLVVMSTPFPVFHSDFSIDLLLNPEDGGDMCLRNIGCLSTGYIRSSEDDVSSCQLFEYDFKMRLDTFPSVSRMPSSLMLRRVALVRTDVSEERSASIIRVTRIGELGTT